MKEELDFILTKYIEEFEKKHDLNFEFAVDDDLMNVLSFGCVFYFDIKDIIFDIENNLPKDLIIDWLYDNLENEGNYINLQSYYKGLRHIDLTNNLKTKI